MIKQIKKWVKMGFEIQVFDQMCCPSRFLGRQSIAVFRVRKAERL
ncbi:MAG: hypothetical protein RL757_2477 [Bacteroidota bacterium]